MKSLKYWPLRKNINSSKMNNFFPQTYWVFPTCKCEVRVMYRVTSHAIHQSINQSTEEKAPSHSINQSIHNPLSIFIDCTNQAINQVTTVPKSVFSLNCWDLQVLIVFCTVFGDEKANGTVRWDRGCGGRGWTEPGDWVLVSAWWWWWWASWTVLNFNIPNKILQKIETGSFCRQYFREKKIAKNWFISAVNIETKILSKIETEPTSFIFQRWEKGIERN